MKYALALAPALVALLTLAQPGAAALRARSGVDPSSIAAACQPSCTSILTTLDACTSAACECTQANYEALEGCINCLFALGGPYTGVPYAETFLDEFQEGLTATPTGGPAASDPLKPFERATPTSGATVAFTNTAIPLIPNTFSDSPAAAKKGGAAGRGVPFVVGCMVAFVVGTVRALVL
ncbi:hypothetical protein BC834DRAFT_1044643 [Gloeopeniophorella convolvens]|nr:hypothetical protein BC834DRAFT_1044643 [Gloeopeniophorella convolvens]